MSMQYHNDPFQHPRPLENACHLRFTGQHGLRPIVLPRAEVGRVQTLASINHFGDWTPQERHDLALLLPFKFRIDRPPIYPAISESFGEIVVRFAPKLHRFNGRAERMSDDGVTRFMVRRQRFVVPSCLIQCMVTCARVSTARKCRHRNRTDPYSLEKPPR